MASGRRSFGEGRKSLSEDLFYSIDLFSGAGGLSLGLKQAGFKTIFAAESDVDSCKTYAAHTPDADLFCADIRKANLWKYSGQVDLVSGGPPCQPFSSGGQRQATGDERDMVLWFVKAVEAIKPRAFLMENVPGLAIGTRRTYLEEVTKTLGGLGYYVTWKILNAAAYGVPQIRQRLFVVGLRTHIFTFPKETHGPRCESPYVTAGSVVSTEPLGEHNRAKVTYAKKPHLRPNPYHGLLFNGGGRPIDLNQPAPTILASAGGNKTPFIDTRGIVPIYHKHLLEGGAPWEGELPGARRITIKEASALQTFPSEVIFYGPRSSQYRQIGNAVPPRLAVVLGRALLEQINGMEAGAFTGPGVDTHEKAQGALSSQRSLAFFMAKNERNTAVHEAVNRVVNRIEFFLEGGRLAAAHLPARELREAAESLLSKSASIRTAGLFLTFYKLLKPEYDFTDVPEGWRGQYGDKLLCEELSKRDLTLHNNIVAYGENIGSKGSVKNFNPSADPRLGAFAAKIAEASPAEVEKVGDFLASKFAQSKQVLPVLPEVGADVLTFPRAKALFHELVALETEGYVQQFLVASLLERDREKQGVDVITHHPHAADKFDNAAGDIEEKLEGTLHRAYEVTVRPDWKSRISGFKRKMDRFQLRKYVILASGVNKDDEWAEPAKLALKLSGHGRDIAVVDLYDFLNWMAAELSASDLKRAINRVYEFIRDRKLCGRLDIAEKYKELVDNWLDTAASDTA